MGSYLRFTIAEFVPAAGSHVFSLGLNPVSDSYPHIRHETERELLFRERFYHPTRIHQDSGEAAARLQKVIWATFTAKYLPSVVNRILDLPPHGARSAEHYGLQNIYHTTLKFTDIAYLAKFMTSSHPGAEGGKRLLKIMAERLVEYGPIWLNRDQTRPIDYDMLRHTRDHQDRASTLAAHLGCV